MAATPSPEPPRTPRPGRARSSDTLRRFWQQVSEGLAISQLWEQFRSETRASYEFYRKQVDPRVTEKARGPGRVAWVIRDMFWAMLMKLSPARRVVLLLALAVTSLGALEFTFRHFSLHL